MKDMAPNKEALKSLIKVMKEMHLAKLKGYKKADDEEPCMVAKMDSEGPMDKMDPEEDMEDEEEDM